jgi:hypothetical protein
MAPSKFWVTIKSPSLAYWYYCAWKTAITVLTNKSKHAEFTIHRYKMLVDLGLVPIDFYLYGEKESDEEQEGDKE